MSQVIGETPGPGRMLGHAATHLKARLVITALFVSKQTPAEVAARYGVHRAWVYSSKPATKPRATPRSNRDHDDPRPRRRPGPRSWST